MSRWSEIVVRIRALLARGRMEHELDEELAFHLDMETRKNLDRGMAPEEARRQALLRFGGVDRFTERTRESWGTRWLEDFGSDLRFALRQLVKKPGFAALSIVTLALGIGATAAIFSVVHGLMVRPLPYQDEGSLVVFWHDYNWRGVEFDFARERLGAFDGLAAFSNAGVSLRGDGGSSLQIATVASAELFDVLGVEPLLGRTFRPGDDRPGAEPVVVLGHALWQQEMGADPAVVGRRILLDGEPVTVAGVMPPGFWFPDPEFQLYRPLDLDPSTDTYQGNGWLVLVGRTRDDAGTARVQGDLDALGAALGERFQYTARWDKSRNPSARPLREYLLGSVEPALLLLLGAVGLLLTCACANVAALFLARTLDRSGELAVRSALGARRGRLVRQILAEALVLGVLAGAVGTLMAAGVFRVLVGALPLPGGFAQVLTLDASLLAAGFVLSVVVAAVVSLAPLRSLAGPRVGSALTGERGETGTGGGTRRVQSALVAAEVVLAVTLVSGAALFARSVSQLYARDLGLVAEGVLAVDVYVGAGDRAPEERRAFFEALPGDVASLPGVRSAALIQRLPLRDGGYQGAVAFEGRPDLTGSQAPTSYYRVVTPDVFETLGIEVVQGRGLDELDRAGTEPVAVVSEAFARLAWPGEDPIGRRFRRGSSLDGDGWTTVVGVAGDVRIVGVREDAPPVMYTPLGQDRGSPEGFSLVVRHEGDPASLVPALRARIGELEPAAVLHRTGTLEDVVRASLAEPLRLRFFLALFGGLAVVLGMVGVYGVVSYAVSRRVREYGIRLALGAEPERLVAGVVGRGLLPVATGVGVGVALSLALGRLVAGLLYQVPAADPVSLGGAAGLLLLAGAAAALVPAIRAARVEPVRALRAE